MVNTTTGVKKPAQGGGGGVLPLASLNHISVVCRSLESSLAFYCNVLGFIPIRRPGSFDFSGAWLFNYGVGIHLLQAEDPESVPAKKTEINPKDNHISFACESMETVQRRLKEMGIRYVQRRVEEGGIYVDQLFFHDPDGFMIEVCTCDNLPVIPLVPVDAHAAVGLPPAACCKRPVAKQQQQHPTVVPAAVPAPALTVCKRATMHQQQLTVPAAVPAAPAPPPPQCVQAKANGVGGCVGEVVDEKNMSACAMMSCPENACMQV